MFLHKDAVMSSPINRVFEVVNDIDGFSLCLVNPNPNEETNIELNLQLE